MEYDSGSDESSQDRPQSGSPIKHQQIILNADSWFNVGTNNKQANYKPEGRYGHTALEVSDGAALLMYTLGGANSNGQMCRELLEFNFEVKLFEHGRNFPTSVIFNKNIYVFGGKSNGYYNDLHVFNLTETKWTKLETKGTPPSPRYGHSACVWGKKMVVFGGYDNDGFTSDEVFFFDLVVHEWQKIAYSKKNNVPAPRFHHTCVVYENQMYLFGGRDVDESIWAFDLENKTWARINVIGPKPSARYGHSWNLVGGDKIPSLLMFGGTNGLEDFNEVWTFNIRDGTWTSNQQTAKKSGPEARFFHSSLVYQGSVLIFGGKNSKNNAFDDIIEVPVRIGFSSLVPDEIWLKILSKLDLVALCRVNCVSKEWQNLSNDGKLWKELVKEYRGEIDSDAPLTTNFKKALKTMHKRGGKWSLTKKGVLSKGLVIKLVFVGDSVGKTSFLLRFTSRSFVTDYVPSVFDNYAGQIVLKDVPVAFSLWDTRCCHDYDRLRALSYPGTDVFVMMFSVVSPPSLANITGYWYPEVTRHIPDAIRLLVGTKNDLSTSEPMLERLRERHQEPVTDEQARKVMQTIGAADYIACSARTGENIDSVVHTALRLAVEKISSDSHPNVPKKNRCLMM